MRVGIGWALASAIAIGIALQPGLAAAGGGPAHDGPFGLYVGEPVSALGPVQRNDDQKTYVVLHPPAPDPVLTTINVTAFPGPGVCVIVGSSKDIENDAAGAQVQALADQLSQTLTARYGPSAAKQADCTDSAQWCGEQWVESLYSGHADYGYSWKIDPADNPQHLSQIILKAKATTADKAHVTVSYIGDNSEACTAANAQAHAPS